MTQEKVTHVKITDATTAEECGWPMNEPVKVIDCEIVDPDNLGNDIWVFSRKKLKAVRLYPKEYQVAQTKQLSTAA